MWLNSIVADYFLRKMDKSDSFMVVRFGLYRPQATDQSERDRRAEAANGRWGPIIASPRVGFKWHDSAIGAFVSSDLPHQGFLEDCRGILEGFLRDSWKGCKGTRPK